LSGTKKLVHRVTEPLVHRGILKRERASFLLFFERTVFPTVNPAPERRLIDELGQAIRMDTDPREVPTRTRLILGIADSTGLLRANFDKKELKRLKRRIQSLKEADPFAQAVEKAVGAAVAAMNAG
jgi:hypothetical protein